MRWTGNDRPDYDWSLIYVYVGSKCGDCNGRGRCWRGTCTCELDWKGLKCLVVLLNRNKSFTLKGVNCEHHFGGLLSSVRETFDNKWSEEVWSKVNGGSVSSICGTLDSGSSLHFHEVIRSDTTLHAHDDLQEIRYNSPVMRSLRGNP